MKTETTPVPLDPKWYTVAQVARLLGYGETKGPDLDHFRRSPIAEGWTLEASAAGMG